MLSVERLATARRFLFAAWLFDDAPLPPAWQVFLRDCLHDPAWSPGPAVCQAAREPLVAWAERLGHGALAARLLEETTP